MLRERSKRSLSSTLLRALKQREKTIPAWGLPRLTEALECLVKLYDATGNAAEADRWRKELTAHKAAEMQA